VRDAVRRSLRAHICGLAPASDVNWLPMSGCFEVSTTTVG
jgi:hypothetical protein